MQPASEDEDVARRQVRFTLRQGDMVAAQRRFHFGRLWSRTTPLSIASSLLVVAAFVAITMSDAPWPWILFVFGAALLGGILVPLAMIRWYVPIVARRIYGQQRSLHREIEVDWDETEFRAATEAGHSRIAWADYFRWREDRDVILLYHAENLFQILPKRVLSATQIDDLRGIAAGANLKGAASITSSTGAA